MAVGDTQTSTKSATLTTKVLTDHASSPPANKPLKSKGRLAASRSPTDKCTGVDIATMAGVENMAGRALRSNAKPTEDQELEVLPAPAEFADKYFFKDFGVHGIFVGSCISYCKNGHKNGRDDVYTVKYDDGDIEDLQYRDVRKMIKKSPADFEAYKNAEAKRAEVLEAMKKAEPARHKQNTESAKNSTKIGGRSSAISDADDNGYRNKLGGDTSGAMKGAGVAGSVTKNLIDLSLTKKTKPNGVSSPGFGDAKTGFHKKTEPKIKGPKKDKDKDKKFKKRKRKNSTKSISEVGEDDESEQKRSRVKIECNTHAGFGWLHHHPYKVSRILRRRARTVYEYEVEWAGGGHGRTWEPAANIHSKLVNDFDRLLEEQEKKLAATPAPALAGSTAVHSGSFSAASHSIANGHGSYGASSQPATLSNSPQVAQPAPQFYHTVNGQCQHPLCQQQYLIDSYRSVLKFMEPPGWAETAQRVDQIADSALGSFPITAFLEFYGHTIQEMMQVRDARVHRAEVKLAEAEHRALTAETQVELLTSSARDKH